MNMCADPENNALFNSGPLNKPVFYVMWNHFTVPRHNRIQINTESLHEINCNYSALRDVLIDNKIFVFDIGIIGFLYT